CAGGERGEQDVLIEPGIRFINPAVQGGRSLLMRIHFRCWHCRSPLGIRASRAGETLHCPRCHSELIVPAVSDAPVPQSSVPQPTSGSLWPVLAQVGVGCTAAVVAGGLLLVLAWPKGSHDLPSQPESVDAAEAEANPPTSLVAWDVLRRLSEVQPSTAADADE